jgi:dipeptidase E
MKKIIAIGGGEIGRPGVKNETLAIDRHLIKSTDKIKPKLLFIPTASGDAEGYIDSANNYFGKRLGCDVDVLTLTKTTYTLKELKDKIFKADIIYVGGGTTLKMMKIWRKFGVDVLLKEAHSKGVVMSGLSAGSICWFSYGNSDTSRFGKNKTASMIKVKALGILPFLHCPHYDIEVGREESLKEMMKKTSGVAIAVDNCAAIEVIDDEFRILRSKPTANAYKVYWNKGKYYKEQIVVSKKLASLSQLLKK